MTCDLNYPQNPGCLQVGGGLELFDVSPVVAGSVSRVVAAVVEAGGELEGASSPMPAFRFFMISFKRFSTGDLSHASILYLRVMSVVSSVLGGASVELRVRSMIRNV